MKMRIEVDVHVSEEDKENNLPFIEQVITLFKNTYHYDTDYRPDGTPRVTVSFWNEDGTPYDLSYKGEQT